MQKAILYRVTGKIETFISRNGETFSDREIFAFLGANFVTLPERENVFYIDPAISIPAQFPYNKLAVKQFGINPILGDVLELAAI